MEVLVSLKRAFVLLKSKSWVGFFGMKFSIRESSPGSFQYKPAWLLILGDPYEFKRRGIADLFT